MSNFLTGFSKLRAWSERTFYIDFINYSTLASDSEVRFYPTSGGGSTQLNTFDGTVIAMHSVGAIITESGTIKVKKVSAPETVYDSIEVEFKEECANPIYLKWLNDYGGLSTWLFDQDQIFRIDPQEDGRYPEKTVVARNLTIEDWKALQELNRTGAEYGDNEKQGAYVVDFTDESDPINVFTIAEPKDTQTKFSKNEFQIQLRYPLAENIVI